MEKNIVISHIDLKKQITLLLWITSCSKIKEISLNTQVITITHLPQVASLSNSHIKISKEVKGNRTFTSIKELSLDEKIYEIALMISDGKVSEKQLEYAKEMVLSNI